MNITVTHTIDPNLVNILQGIFGGLNGQVAAPKANGKAKEIAASKEITPAIQTATTADTSTPAAEEKTVTLSEVRAMVQTKSTEGKKENIRALLADFGLPNVTGLKANQYQDFYEKVQAL